MIDILTFVVFMAKLVVAEAIILVILRRYME